MTYSVRAMLIVVTMFAIACAIGINEYRSYSFARLKIKGDYDLRLWVEKTTMVRELPDFMDDPSLVSGTVEVDSLFMEIKREGKVLLPTKRIVIELKNSIHQLGVRYTSDEKIAVVFSKIDGELLVIADLEQAEFASPLTIWCDDYEAIWYKPGGPTRGFSDTSPGPVRARWQSILRELKSDQPDLEIDWDCI